MTNKWLQPGDVFMLTQEHVVRAEVPEHFLYENRKGVFDKLSYGTVELKDPNFEYLRGKYIVTYAGLSGGGTGHGPHDVYPDGWCINAQKADNPNIKISFYQSGCFNCKNEGIKAIGRAKQTWTIVEE